MKIGNVELHLDYYDDSYQYSEGDIEEELLEIVRTHASYEEVLKNDTRWPILYHLHRDRENILAWYPFDGTEEVLEVGAGCGAITGLLARKCRHVICNEISLRRSKINAYKNAEYDNIEIFVGNFNDVPFDRQFDVITLIGVLEYAESYIHSETPYLDMLKCIKGKLKSNGRAIIAIENKFGLKYWAGCKEDHTGRYYEGIEGYPNSSGVKTFSHKKLQEMLQEAGFQSSEFYYPMPDYKLPKVIFSDRYLPTRDSLPKIVHNYDSDRLHTFNEADVYAQLIKEDMFGFFANSFLVFAGN